MARSLSAMARIIFSLGLVAYLGSGCGDEIVNRTVVAPSTSSDGGASGLDGGMDGGLDGAPCDGSECVPQDAVCGNGVREEGEQCDEGLGDDRCDRECRLIACGNGDVDPDEECDDGNLVDGDGCSFRCRLEPAVLACGDGELTPDLNEECDDGNLDPGDGCDDMCRTERCGDRRVSAGEQCDPPVAGTCTLQCLHVLPNCGDGTLQDIEGEECDDSNNIRGDGCDGCRLECGNGRVEASIGEQCEPAYAPTRCNPLSCRFLPVCGDGVFQPEAGEECDLGAFQPPAGLLCEDCRLVPESDDSDGGVTEVPSCVPARPIIANGGFDTSADGWVGRTRVTVLHEAGDGAAERGSLKLIFAPHPTTPDNGLEVSGAQQCIRVAPETAYEFRGLFRVQANTSQVSAQMRVVELESEDCTGPEERIVGLSLGSVPGPWWIPYERPIVTSAGTRSMLLILSIAKPRNLIGQMLWDDIGLRPSGVSPTCGNCETDAEIGETCDDGNFFAGDGCSPACRRELCGDGVIAAGEVCDDGNLVLGDASDTCTPGCRTKTECEACIGNLCAAQAATCYGLEGSAQAGPAAGTPRATLCDDLRACVRESGCAGRTAIAEASELSSDFGNLDNCYCGTADEQCFEPNRANGQCKAQFEAALETTDPVDVLARLSGAVAAYPIVGAMRDLLLCEGVLYTDSAGLQQCNAQCAVEATCGDGVEQDRTATAHASLTYLAADSSGIVRPRMCSEDTSYSQPGCWVEECDDGNQDNGDGCDNTCFLETCGNGRLQEGEECDDGNDVAGDGCDASCGAEFECGDGTVVEPFEECDPPATGTVCTQQQYDADPSQCGCDNRCFRTVCGNGVTQAPEECDPPGPACTDQCTRSEDECVGCLRLVDPEIAAAMDIYCMADGLLDGDPALGVPGLYERGCQNDPVCYDLLLCALESNCAQEGIVECYCGETVEQVMSCPQSSFQPMGMCRDELLAAFEAWNGGPPANNGDFLDNVLVANEVRQGRYPAASAVDLLTRYCHRDDSRSPSLGDLITASGHPAEAQRCMAACF